MIARLVDPDHGVCSRRARFTEAHVHEAVCALSEGQWDAPQVRALADALLGSAHAVRLAPAAAAEWCESPRWSTVEHRALEDHVLGRLDQLAERHDAGVAPHLVEDAIARQPSLGVDQADAIRQLCAAGPAVRTLIAPAGHGKTTAVREAAEAYRLAGRPVLGLATTNTAVEELVAVGLRAMTIARLRLELRDGGFERGTVLVVDEVSQVSTRDAAVLLDAVAVTPGTGVWFLGDPRQGTSVAAGGIAAEVALRGRAGAIVAPELVENRRQIDAADRHALAELRAGKAAESQAIRSGRGWEREHETAVATRDAMADAVVADIVRHGPDAVAALAVSHVDCEDVADRIRRRLIEQGHIAREGITGPGWAAGDRMYAVGDRVLLHATLKSGPMRLHNGSVGTVVSAGPNGLQTRFAAGEMTLPTAFVAGMRPDGTPNLSHAWARTIDGAQGGTWDAVHLLGSSGLDALSGYVGQSRSRTPTHTWNVRRAPAVDHGGILADDRDGAEQVLAALRREPDVTFAGIDDPWPLDRRLRAEQAEHRQVLARCPEDRSWELSRARDEHQTAGYRVTDAEREVERSRQALKELGRLPRVRANGRAARLAAENRVAGAVDDLDRCKAVLATAQQGMNALVAHQAECDGFLGREGWRTVRIAAIDQELAHHWAPVVLAAVRNDDALAFGLHRLREARLTYVSQLDALLRTLPPDRSDAVQRARAEVDAARRALADARSDVADAGDALDDARRRHWGRRDRDAIESAQRRSEHAQGRLSAAVDCERDARCALTRETDAQRARESALRANRGPLTNLEEAVADVEQALERTRAERVAAMARGDAPRSHLTDVLGEPPTSSAGRQAWCGLAWEIESHRDEHPGPVGRDGDGSVEAALGTRPEWFGDRLEWDALALRVAGGRTIIAIAEGLSVGEAGNEWGDPASWSTVVDKAVEARRADLALAPEPAGIDFGL
ncbi:MAG: AAA family ATPase [Acidimicrobiales bacterium]